jgi:hypothetical protein
MSCRLIVGLVALALCADARAGGPKKQAEPMHPSEAGDNAPAPEPAPAPKAEQPAPAPEAKPDQAKPDAKPEEAKPEEAKPEEAKPEEPKPAAKPEPKKEAPDTRPRMSARFYEDADPALADSMEAAFAEVLQRDSRVRFRSIADTLEPPEKAARELGRADIALIDAEKAFSEMDLDKAKNLLKDAIQTYQRYLPELAQRGGGTEGLRDAWVKLSKTRFFDGDADGARDALRYAFVLDPKLNYTKSMFPPQMKKAVVEAKLLFEALGPGKIQIDSDPPGAAAYLNGVKLEKPTPSTPADAQPGPNFINYRRRGYQPVGAIFENNGGGETAQAVKTLERPSPNPYGPMDRARAGLDQADAPFPSLKEACKLLDVDMLLLARREGGQVTVALYDARPDRILKRAKKAAADEVQAADAARDLARTLLDGVRLDGVYQPPVPPKKPSRWQLFSEKSREDLSRFRHSKYFWPVIGGILGVVVVGAAAAGGGAAAAVAHQQEISRSVILLGGH